MIRLDSQFQKGANVYGEFRKMESYAYTKNEKNFKKISAFLNVSRDLLNRQHPDLLVKMIKAAEEDKMLEVHHFGMEMQDRF